MKRSKKTILIKILLVAVLLFCGLSMVHVDVKRSDITTTLFNTFMLDTGAPLYAAETENHPAGEYRSGEDVKKTSEGDLPAEETREYVTPLRILSVIAMCVFLVWYIRRKMKL
jgi:hypothetical protein